MHENVKIVNHISIWKILFIIISDNAFPSVNFLLSGDISFPSLLSSAKEGRAGGTVASEPWQLSLIRGHRSHHVSSAAPTTATATTTTTTASTAATTSTTTASSSASKKISKDLHADCYYIKVQLFSESWKFELLLDLVRAQATFPILIKSLKSCFTWFSGWLDVKMYTRGFHACKRKFLILLGFL